MIEDLLSASAEAYSKATPEEIELSEYEQYKFNITYSIYKFLTYVADKASFDWEISEAWNIATEISEKARTEDSIIDACCRWDHELAKSELIEKSLKPEDARNEVGNSERFAREYCDNLKFLRDRKVWLKWDKKRWRELTDEQVLFMAKKTAKRMFAEALISGDKEDKAWAQSTLSRRGLSNMVACASSEPVFESDMSQFDQNPDVLNVQNGTVNLETGRLRPHRREDMITTLTKIKYDKKAICKRWEEFLLEVFDNNKELVDSIQRFVGYSLTGHTREQVLFILFGGGRNGKGRFIKQLMMMLGDAAKTTSFKTFVNKRNDDSNTPALASLVGARLVSAGEPDQGVYLSESTIKMLTGEDEIEVCRKFEQPFRYTPTYKIWIHCNHKPKIKGTDEGIWGRPRLIPFNVTFKTESEFVPDGTKRKDPDKNLDAKLDAERVGILAWAVRGSMLWYEQGLGKCEVVDKATKNYREESDIIGPFIEDCITEDDSPRAFVTNDALFRAYGAWCRNNLVDNPVEGQTLSKLLVAKGFKRGKNSNDVRGFLNIKVRMPGALLEVVPGGKPSEAVITTEKN